MLENSERSVRRVCMGKSGRLECVELANQIQGFRIPDRWHASEKNNESYVQAFGRVGRDGMNSEALLLFHGRQSTSTLWVRDVTFCQVHYKIYQKLQRIDGTRKYEALLMPSVVSVMFLESMNQMSIWMLESIASSSSFDENRLQEKLWHSVLKLLLHDLLLALKRLLSKMSCLFTSDNNQCLIRFLFTIHMFWLIGKSVFRFFRSTVLDTLR